MKGIRPWIAHRILTSGQCRNGRPSQGRFVLQFAFHLKQPRTLVPYH